MLCYGAVVVLLVGAVDVDGAVDVVGALLRCC